MFLGMNLGLESMGGGEMRMRPQTLIYIYIYSRVFGFSFFSHTPWVYLSATGGRGRRVQHHGLMPSSSAPAFTRPNGSERTRASRCVGRAHGIPHREWTAPARGARTNQTFGRFSDPSSASTRVGTLTRLTRPVGVVMRISARASSAGDGGVYPLPGWRCVCMYVQQLSARSCMCVQEVAAACE